jgi:alpha/beta superfamily hydrolase
MMNRITIPADDVVLEAVLSESNPALAGVVAHPHPLYGGSMHNNVVDAAARGLEKAGWTWLKFNFRGVGQSTGAHGDGIGEQADIAACAAYLKERGAEKVVVAGYSFGAHVAAFAWERLDALGVEPLILIAPPAAFMDFNGLSSTTRVGLMVCGQLDQIAPPDMAADIGMRLDIPVKPLILDGADHFLNGYEGQIADVIAEHLNGLPG